MQTSYLLLMAFAVVVPHTFAGSFPKFIHKCKVSDPKFDECALTSANSFLTTIHNGDDKHGIPAFVDTEYNVTKTYNLTDSFTLSLTRLSPGGFTDFVITHIHFDFDGKMLTFSGKQDHRLTYGTYEAAGEILGKPAHETGKANMTIESTVLNATMPLDFKMKNDKKYLEVVSAKLNFDANGLDFKTYDQVTVGEPMTAEQKKEYQTYFDKIPEIFKKENEANDKELVESMNKLFALQPFDEIFLP